MAKADYSNTQKYSNRRSFDGKPVSTGKVLVPFRKELYGLRKSDYIQDNFTTMHLGEFRYEIGFMAIDEDRYASYMKDFWNEINEDMKLRREGRCIIGKNPDGSDKLCPYTRRCKGCPDKGLLERFNPNRVEILSLDYEYDGETFDIKDTSQPSVEDQVLDAICRIKIIIEENYRNKVICGKDKTIYERIRIKIRLQPQSEACENLLQQRRRTSDQSVMRKTGIY